MVVGEFSVETELVVIGGGPGGYGAALRAAELGVQTTIVHDRELLGGAWLHEGCLYSKELLGVTATLRAAQQAARVGVTFAPPQIEIERLRAHLAKTGEAFAASVSDACDRLGVVQVQGRARFDDSRQISIEDSPAVPRLRFKRAVIATGSHHLPLPAAPADHARIVTPGDALAIGDVPPRLLVIGGSAVALEIATIYHAFGSRVTIVDHGPRLVSFADEDLVAPVTASLGEQVDEVRLSTAVTDVRETADGTAVDLEGPSGHETCTFDRIVVAIGRTADLTDLGLERTRVRTGPDGWIIVDEALRTTDPRIFAVGDVVGEPLLAIKAAHQARVAAEVIAGWESRYDPRSVPMVLFTDPQIAWCGVSEAEAVASGRPHRVQRSRWGGGQHASGFLDATGFTKIIYEPDTGLVLGVGIVGRGAAELIAEASLALEMGAVIDDLAATMHPHPTRSEFLGAAARDALEPDSEHASRRSTP